MQPTSVLGTLWKPLQQWLVAKDRIPLMRWSAGFFTLVTVAMLAIGLRYLSVYSFPPQPLAVFYTFAAYTSHFGSIGLVVWIVLILPIVTILPIRKVVIPWTVLISSGMLCIELLDTQVFAEHRFHFNLLTIRILGWKTWGFGIGYLIIFSMFNALLALNAWKWFVEKRRKMYLIWTSSATILLLLATHGLHMWADACTYVPITRFTSYLPIFFPSVDKEFMVQHKFVNLQDVRTDQIKLASTTDPSDLFYPKKPLAFQPSSDVRNILIIAIDQMRADALSDSATPAIMRYARSGSTFTNHWSGGNSSRAGLFTLFYGIPSTYDQYFASNRRSAVLVDRLQEEKYGLGIFVSYRLWSPADLDVTAFAKVPNLRLETKIPGPPALWRNDSTITDEWKSWLDTAGTKAPFFGFLFYDALCRPAYPPAYEQRVHYPHESTKRQKKKIRYAVSMQYIDSLVGVVLDDLQNRDLLRQTAVIITADHGEEFDDNTLGFHGHGSAFDSYQVKVPMILLMPGSSPGISGKRTSHYDIVPTLMTRVLGCTNPASDYSSGNDLLSDAQWDWVIVGSYYNYAVVEPTRTTVEFPGGYFEVRDTNYEIMPAAKPVTTALSDAFAEMGRFYKK